MAIILNGVKAPFFVSKCFLCLSMQVRRQLFHLMFSALDAHLVQEPADNIIVGILLKSDFGGFA